MPTEVLGARLARERVARAGKVVLRAELAEDLGDAEVDDLHVVAAVLVGEDHDVLGLEIAVDDAERVGAIERARSSAEELHRLGARQPELAAQAAIERLAFDELHHEVRLALFGHAEVEDLHRVPRLEARGDLRLGEEALARRRVRSDRAVEQLDRDVRFQRQVLRAPHLAHAALPEEFLELVAPTQEARGFR